MPSGHFGFAGPYTRDPGAELQQWHRERLAKQERIDRAVRWLGEHVVGTYHSLDALVFASCAVMVTYKGQALREDEHEVIESACRIIFAGLGGIGAKVKIGATGYVESVTFPKAA